VTIQVSVDLIGRVCPICGHVYATLSSFSWLPCPSCASREIKDLKSRLNDKEQGIIDEMILIHNKNRALKGYITKLKKKLKITTDIVNFSKGNKTQ